MPNKSKMVRGSGVMTVEGKLKPQVLLLVMKLRDRQCGT